LLELVTIRPLGTLRDGVVLFTEPEELMSSARSHGPGVGRFVPLRDRGHAESRAAQGGCGASWAQARRLA